MAVVLVVDDEPDVRTALSTMLEMEGHEVLEAADGMEVLPAALEDAPDLILLDISMPVMDGFEVLRELGRDESLSRIPVIRITAKGSPEDRVLGRELGAIDYIGKPWAPGEVELRSEWALRKMSRVQADPVATSKTV